MAIDSVGLGTQVLRGIGKVSQHGTPAASTSKVAQPATIDLLAEICRLTPNKETRLKYLHGRGDGFQPGQRIGIAQIQIPKPGTPERAFQEKTLSKKLMVGGYSLPQDEKMVDELLQIKAWADMNGVGDAEAICAHMRSICRP